MHSTARTAPDSRQIFFLRPRVAQVGGGKEYSDAFTLHKQYKAPSDAPMHMHTLPLRCTTALQEQVQTARLASGRHTLALLRAAAPQLLHESTRGKDGSHPAARLSPQRHKSHVHMHKKNVQGQQPSEPYLRFRSQLNNTHSVMQNGVPALLASTVHPLQGQGLYLAD